MQSDLALDRALFGAEGDPLSYPGVLPTRPCLLDGRSVIDLAWDGGRLLVADTLQGVDGYLTEAGAAPIALRTAQIAYGANRDLHNLAWKLSAYGQTDASSRLAILLPATLRDADIVASSIGYWGYVYSAVILHRPPMLVRPYLAGAEVEVALLLLDEHQVRAMHRSEGVPLGLVEQRPGVSCDLAIATCDVRGTSIEVDAQIYVSAREFMSLDGVRPMPYAAVGRRGGTELQRLTQREMWAHIVARLELGAVDDVVAALRAGALARAAGDPGPSEQTFDLYHQIQRGISAEMSLSDGDGLSRVALDDVPWMLAEELAWAGEPRVGDRIQG